MKLIVSDVIPCVLKFLSDCGFTETFQTLRKECDINTKSGLSQANLLKICKFYIKNHPDVWIDEDESEEFEKRISMESEQELRVINSKRLAFRDITVEDLNESENEEELEQEIVQIVEPTKKIKTEKNENTNKKSKKKNKKNKKEADQKELQQANNEEILEETLAYNEEKENKKKNKERFSYVDAGIIGDIPEDLRDNTYEAKAKYGEGDEFGRFGNERLKEVKGRDFKKEKAKLKNKQFHGGGGRIDPFAKSSVKLNFED